MALYRVVKKAKDGTPVGVGTLRTRAGKPIQLELRVSVSGKFSLIAEDVGDTEPTVPGVRLRSGRGTA